VHPFSHNLRILKSNLEMAQLVGALRERNHEHTFE